MNKYYFPTSSLNFNSIMATESISPDVVYKLREFSYRRNEKVLPNNMERSVLLYENLPEFESAAFETESYPIYIEVQLDESFIRYRSSQNGIGYIQYPGTIYLTRSNCRIYFRSRTEKERVLAKSLQSIETKLVGKYRENFFCLDEEPNKIDIFSFREKTLTFKDTVSDSYKTVLTDRKINTVKGFLYGYLLGSFYLVSPELQSLKLKIRDIRNILSSLINKIEQKSFGDGPGIKKRNLSYFTSGSDQFLSEGLRKMTLLVKDCDILLKKYEQSPSEILIEKIYGFGIQNPDEFISNCKKIPFNERLSLFDVFLNQYHKALKNISGYLSYIIKLLDNYFNTGSKDQSNKELHHLQQSVEQVLDNIHDQLKKYELNELKENKPYNIGDILFSNHFNLLRISDNKEYNKEAYIAVINTLISEFSARGNELPDRKSILNRSGEVLSEFYPEWKQSRERGYMVKLVMSISGQSNDFLFEESEDLLLSSLAAFILRIEKAEELNDFLDKNNISDKSLAFGLWGCIHGFADFPRTIFEPFISISDTPTIDLIDQFLVTNLYSAEIPEEPGANKKQHDEIKAVVNDTNRQEKVKPAGDYFVKAENDRKSVDNEAFVSTFLQLIKQEKDLNNFHDWIEKCVNNALTDSNAIFDAGSEMNTINMRIQEQLLKPDRPKNFGQAKVKKIMKMFNSEHSKS